MNTYLIPANTKRSRLILGLFTKADAVLFAIGIAISLVLLFVLDVGQLVQAVIALLPGLICGFLVMPVPNYYNMRTLINSVIKFYTNQRKFKWKGWCALNGEQK